MYYQLYCHKKNQNNQNLTTTVATQIIQDANKEYTFEKNYLEKDMFSTSYEVKNLCKRLKF